MTHLEREALKSHKAGEDWSTFFRRVGSALKAAAPLNAKRYREIFHRVWCLQRYGNGEPDPQDPTPWQFDEGPAYSEGAR
jgi:hypothetical protein